jgi:bacteriorhodopsin
MPELPNGCLRPNGTFKSSAHECVMDDECLMDCQVVEHEDFYATKEYNQDTCDLGCGCTFISNFDGILTCIDGVHSCDRGEYGPGPEGKLCCTEIMGSIGNLGQLALYASFLAMFISSGWFASTAWAAPIGSRLMYWVAFMTTMIASLAYLTMSVGYGYYFMAGPCRQFWYARYIDWALTTPLMLFEMCTLARASQNTVTWLCGVDFLMIVTGLIGGFVGGIYEDNDRWLFFAFGILMFLPIIRALKGNGGLGDDMDRAVKTGVATEEEQRVLGRLCTLTLVTWCCYPAVWFLCEGTNRLTADQEMVAYGILDVLAKCMWGFHVCSLSKKPKTPVML